MNYALAVKCYLVAFILLAFFSSFIKTIKLTKKKFIFFWGLFVISMGIIGLNFTPPLDWDISLHCIFLNEIRTSGINLLDFLFINTDNIGGDSSKTLFCFNIIRYLIVHLTDNNFWLPTICAIIDYSILGYITMDWSYKIYGYYKIDFISLVVSLGTMGFDSVFSGMRTALALSFAALGIYLYMVKNKGFITLIIFFLVAVTIHQVALIPLFLVILYNMKLGQSAYILILIAFGLLPLISQIFINSNYLFLRTIGTKYYSYVITGESSLDIGKYSYILFVGYILYLILYLIYYSKERKIQNSQKSVYNFLPLYILFVVLNIGTLEMFERPSIMFGCFAPVFSESIINFKAKETFDKIIVFILKLLIICIFFIRAFRIFYVYRNVFF